MKKPVAATENAENCDGDSRIHSIEDLTTEGTAQTIFDVILSGGEAGGRDLTSAGCVDVVDGNPYAAGRCGVLFNRIHAALCRTVPRTACAVLRMT